MLKTTILAATLALGWPIAANAQAGGGLQSCEEAGADLISLAADEHGRGIRSFYRGSVTLFELNTEEPAAAPAGIAIVMPAPPVADEPAFSNCWAITGFGSVDVERARATYDAATGLTLTIATTLYDADRNIDMAGPPIRLRINAPRGTIVDLNSPRR